MPPWTRSPTLLKLFVGQHIANGLGVAVGVMSVAVVATVTLGFGGGFACTLGAIAASIGDFPAALKDKAKSMSVGFVLALASTGLALCAQHWLPLQIGAIGLISFAAGMVTGFGRWALTTSMQMLIAMVLALGLPPTDFHGVLVILARMLAGGVGYIAISILVSRLLAASDRRMMASEALRELSAYLFAYARFADPQADLGVVYGRVIRQQAALSEQLQSARALLLENPRATPERLRLAASIGLLLDTLDALIAAQCDLPALRGLPAAAEWMRRVGVLIRTTALDIQHLSLDMLGSKAPALPRDHQVARDAFHREGFRLIADEDTPADVRAAVLRTLTRFDASRAAITRLERALGDVAAAEASIGLVKLSAFRPTRSFNLKLLRPHWTPASPIFRYAARLSLAMIAGGIAAIELGGERHGNWVLLTIAVILRAGYGLTRQRRDDRVVGTLIGCVIASAAVAYLPAWALLFVQAGALATAHGFARLGGHRRSALRGFGTRAPRWQFALLRRACAGDRPLRVANNGARRRQDRRARDVARGGRGGLLCLSIARGLRRRRRRLSPRGRLDGANGEEGRRRLRRLAAQRDRRALHPSLRLGGAEEALAAAHGVRRIRRRDRDVRARRRLRPAGRQDQRRKDGNQYVISGQKTFITNGQTANLIIVVAKTDPSAGAKGNLADRRRDRRSRRFRARPQARQARAGRAGHVGAVLQRRARADRQPARPEEGRGFVQLMQQLPQERLNIASGHGDDRARARADDRLCQGAQGVRPSADRFPEHAVQARRVQDRGDRRPRLRRSADRPASRRQARRRHGLDGEILGHRPRNKIVDECLQLFGGYGYMNEYPIGRMFRDSRVQRIYGGTNEIMKVLIARTQDTKVSQRHEGLASNQLHRHLAEIAAVQQVHQSLRGGFEPSRTSRDSAACLTPPGRRALPAPSATAADGRRR
jgi:hypothetical protein